MSRSPHLGNPVASRKDLSARASIESDTAVEIMPRVRDQRLSAWPECGSDHDRRSCKLACRASPRPVRAAPLAQSAERLHGKEKVYGSIP
jgi:hypothetical protein